MEVTTRSCSRLKPAHNAPFLYRAVRKVQSGILMKKGLLDKVERVFKNIKGVEWANMLFYDIKTCPLCGFQCQPVWQIVVHMGTCHPQQKHKFKVIGDKMRVVSKDNKDDHSKRDSPYFLFSKKYQVREEILFRHLFRKEGLYVIKDHSMNKALGSIYDKYLLRPILVQSRTQYYSFPNVMIQETLGEQQHIAQDDHLEQNQMVDNQLYLSPESRYFMKQWNAFADQQKSKYEQAYAQKIKHNNQRPVQQFTINYRSISAFVRKCQRRVLPQLISGEDLTNFFFAFLLGLREDGIVTEEEHQCLAGEWVDGQEECDMIVIE